MLTRLIPLAAILVLATQALAHEFWIQPLSFHPKLGENIGIRLMVGDGFPGEPRPRDPTKLESFVVAGTAWAVPIPGTDGEDPAGLHRFEREGVQALGYRSKNSRIELDAVKFEEYLKEEGLEAIIEKRKVSGDSDKPGRELFSRCSKSLVCIGEPTTADQGFLTSLKHPLEITPTENPYLKKPGDTLQFLITNTAGPVPDATVMAFLSTDPKKHQRFRTDKDGHVTIPLTGEGIWMINCIQMTEAPKGSDADWQSLWANLTFEIRAAAPAVTDNKSPVPAQQATGK
ncbi:MAG: DUF4198 domain-containing protein [Phycisphaerales bacterium]|nr:DUF4198 domain-containing protein [Phycisphaerales bacterium]